MKKQYIIPIFVPHLGCPNDCVFCNQKSISGQLKMTTPEDVKKTIEQYLESFKQSDASKEIAFYGGSFTGIDIDIQKELLEVASEYVKNGKIDSIRLSTRPDYIDKNILKMLKKYKVKTIELGVQSTNNYILEKTGRNHTFEDVKKASRLIKWHGFTLGHQMMIGLPESTRLDELNTAKDLIKLKPKMIRIYPTLVIKNTKLEEEYNNGQYIPLTLTQAIERSKELVYMFNKKAIEIIRIGLQNTDLIKDPKQTGSNVIAGPYHEAFGQLVESSIWYDSIVDKIKKINVKVKQVEIKVNPEDINNVIGHGKQNILKLKETYDVDVKIIGDEQIKQGKSELKILEIYDIEDKIKIKNKV